MELRLTAKNIYNHVINERMSKLYAIELLISLLEISEHTETRVDCIKTIQQLQINSKKVFRIVENLFVSDSDTLVRKAAIELLFQNFDKKDTFLMFKWAITHEQSIVVLKVMYDLFESIHDPHYLFFKNKLVKRLGETLRIPLKEVELFLNLGVLFTTLTNKFDLRIEGSWFNIMDMVRRFPDSMGLITRLNYIRCGGKKLKPLPKSTSCLSNLKKIYLKSSELHSLPNFWERIKPI